MVINTHRTPKRALVVVPTRLEVGASYVGLLLNDLQYLGQFQAPLKHTYSVKGVRDDVHACVDAYTHECVWVTLAYMVQLASAGAAIVVPKTCTVH